MFAPTIGVLPLPITVIGGYKDISIRDFLYVQVYMYTCTCTSMYIHCTCTCVCICRDCDVYTCTMCIATYSATNVCTCT